MDVGQQQQRQQAAAAIQVCWKSFQLRRLYRFYRNLLREREMGDAATLLRMVNPQEAGLASDVALGTHVRLRLGGIHFPPTIYYKIFTHRSVADVGAFAPRDYVLKHKLEERPRHVKTSSALTEIMGEMGKVGWYQRVENNGWRPISHRILANPDDPVTRYTAARRMTFHPLPTVRREEKLKKQKQRQREWMMRLHMDGRGDATEDSGVGVGPGSTGEWELDDEAGELLAWTEALDFEAYRESWASLATTMGTEAAVPLTLDKLKEAANYSEPFNLLQLPR